MKRRNLCLWMPVLFVWLFLLSVSAYSAYGMKCGNTWINTGDNQLKLTSNCGQPSSRAVIRTRPNLVEAWYYKDKGVTNRVVIVNTTVVSIKMTRF